MKYFKGLLIILIIAFIGLYFTYQNGYYEKYNSERKILTDEMILEYENDLKNGVDVTNKEYVVAKKNYTNIYTSSILKISRKIEKGIDKIIRYFFDKINSSINS